MAAVLRNEALDDVSKGTVLEDWLVAFCVPTKLSDIVADLVSVLELSVML